ncbi:MAG: hypothetical protein KKD44_15010 [Proteobacteria bacterium]|nr:hypothetical protein [Pseudomonadota bacterium]
MKKKKAKKTNKVNSPVSKKVIASFRHYLERKVVDISEVRNSKICAEELQKTIVTGETLSDYDPVHAVYIYAQNIISVLMEQVGECPEMVKIVNPYINAAEEYMPSGPPMSPLTASYFFCWGCFDLWAGLKRETFGTVIIDLCKKMGFDSHLIDVFQKMQDSRMGFYVHEGFSGNKVLLREIITQKQCLAIIPSGYLGERGQVWFARILPEPLPEYSLGYSVVFTTPYILMENDNNSNSYANEKGWISYMERNLEKTGKKEASTAYEFLMKFGFNKTYWNEYIFQGYAGYMDEAVFLAGYPDLPLSMPHSKERQGIDEKHGNP